MGGANLWRNHRTASPPASGATDTVIPTRRRRTRRAHHLNGHDIILGRATGRRVPVKGNRAIAGNEPRRFRKGSSSMINADPVWLHPGVVGNGHAPRCRPQIMPRFCDAAPAALHLGIAGLHIGRAFQRPFGRPWWRGWARWWRRRRRGWARWVRCWFWPRFRLVRRLRGRRRWGWWRRGCR